jgi:hypothetical protein
MIMVITPYPENTNGVLAVVCCSDGITRSMRQMHGMTTINLHLPKAAARL